MTLFSQTSNTLNNVIQDLQDSVKQNGSVFTINCCNCSIKSLKCTRSESKN